MEMRRSWFSLSISIQAGIYQSSSSRSLAIAMPSVFGDEFAFMPVPKRQARQPDHCREQQHAGHGDQEQGGEQARNVELKAGDQDLIGESCSGAAGAGHELGDHSADQR